MKTTNEQARKTKTHVHRQQDGGDLRGGSEGGQSIKGSNIWQWNMQCSIQMTHHRNEHMKSV